MLFPDTYTTIHSVLSLIALFTGALAVLTLFGVRLPGLVTTLFLITAVATSATGFGFAFHGVLPSHIVGVIALLILAAVLYARYAAHLAGAWRWIYSVGLVASLYLLVFVGIAQAFGKIASLHALAPTQSEPPFAITQLVVLAVFVLIALAAAKLFRPAGGAFVGA